jgi:outer membrane protein assembly factor BamB
MAGGKLATLALLGTLLMGDVAQGQSWPQWRGPARSGVTSASSGWDGAKWRLGKRWQVAIGMGLGASPIIADGEVYVMGWSEGDRVWCLSADTGETLWKQTYKSRRDGRFRKGESPEGPTCTPTYDAETKYLYTRGNDGDLHCWDTSAKGKPVWRINLYDAYKVPARESSAKQDPKRDYGYCGNVLIYKDWAIFEVGDPKQGNLIAFDKRTGRLVWASQDRNRAGHSCGPVMMNVGGIPCVVSFTLEGLLVARVDEGHEGKTVAFHPWVMPFNVGIPTPCIRGDVVVLTSTEEYKSGKKTTFLRIAPSGIERTWEGERQAYVCSPVAHEGSVYLADKKLVCLDFATGKLRWEGGRVKGSTGSIIVTGDDKVIVWSHKRLLLVESAKNSRDKYRELAVLDSPIADSRGGSYAHVALGEGRLLVKDRAGKLACYTVGASAPEQKER